MNPNTLNLILNTLKCGFDSRDEEVVLWAVRTVSKLGEEVLKLGMHEQLWQWFSKEDIIDVLLFLIKTCSYMEIEIAPMF